VIILPVLTISSSALGDDCLKVVKETPELIQQIPTITGCKRHIFHSPNQLWYPTTATLIYHTQLRGGS